MNRIFIPFYCNCPLVNVGATYVKYREINQLQRPGCGVVMNAFVVAGTISSVFGESTFHRAVSYLEYWSVNREP